MEDAVTPFPNLEQYRTQSTAGAAPLDRPGRRDDGPRRGLRRWLRPTAWFAVRLVAALATVRAVDAWMVRLEPPWQVAVAVVIAVATALVGASSPRTEWLSKR